MSKHIIIGLGGTGLTMVRALRCIISQELEEREVLIGNERVKRYFSPENATPHDIQLRYLEVDTNTDDLRDPFKGCAPTSGPSLLLGNRYQLSLRNNVGIQGANMRRDMGVKLFSQNAAAFDDKIQTIKDEMTGDGELAIHVCAGLGGGTGSGSVLDTVCRLRKKFHHAGNVHSAVKIYLYLYLPHRHFAHAQGKPQYEPNGYAALSELSSLNTRQWTPFDKSPAHAVPTPYTFDVPRPAMNGVAHPVFNSCYIFERENANGHTFRTGSPKDPMADEVGQLFGYFLFEKLFVWTSPSENARRAIGDLKRADSAENIENDMWEYRFEMDPAVQTTPPQRQRFAIHSNHFQTVGCKRLVVPALEMKRHYAAVLVNEALLRLRYNQLGDAGYTDPEAHLEGEDKEAYQRRLDVRVAELAEDIKRDLISWGLDEDGELTCQKPIIEKESTINIETFWEGKCSAVCDSLLVDDDEPKAWLMHFEEKVSSISKRGYRPVGGRAIPQGTEDFYKTKSSQIDDRVKAHISKWIREKFISKLFAVDENNQLSIEELSLQSRALIKVIRDDSDSCINSCRERLTALGEEIADLKERTQKLREDYTEIGWMGLFTNRKNRLLDYKEDSQKLAVARTQKYALTYALSYLEKLAGAASNLREVTTRILENFDHALRGRYNTAGELEEEGIQAIIQNNCPLDYDIRHALENDICVKFYNPQTIIDNDLKLKTTEALVNIYLNRIRNTIVAQLEQDDKHLTDLSLRDLANHFENAEFKHTLLNSCLELISTDNQFAFALDFNINREIQREFGGAATLTELANTISRTSGLAATINMPEVDKAIPSNSTINNHLNKTDAGFAAETNRGLVEPLMQRLSANLEAGGISYLDSRTQLTVMRIVNGMPPRAFNRVSELYHQYCELQKRDANLETHTDGANKPFPQFFPSAEDVLDVYRGSTKDYMSLPTEVYDVNGNIVKRYLLGDITEQVDPQTNAPCWCSRNVGVQTWRMLVPKRHECFFTDDCIAAVHSTLASLSNPAANFNMQQLYREMEETENNWNAIINPDYLSEEIKEKRLQALQRLQTAESAVKTRHPNPMAREHQHINILVGYYKPLLEIQH